MGIPRLQVAKKRYMRHLVLGRGLTPCPVKKPFWALFLLHSLLVCLLCSGQVGTAEHWCHTSTRAAFCWLEFS